MSKIFIDNDRSENALQRMWKYYQNEQLCDVVLIAGTNGIRIPAHRLVLCAATDYFEKMFTASFVEGTRKEVNLCNDDDSEIVKVLVNYCYTGRIEIGEDNVEKLLGTADYLQLGFVVNACGDFLAAQLHPNNCFALTLLAERHHCESLSKKAKDFCLKRFVEFCKTDDFLELSAEQLSQLISSDDLRVPCEEEVFKSVMTWMEYNRIEREQNKEELFKLVRMPLIKLSFLVDHVRPLCTTVACLQLYTDATEWHLLPERRTINASIIATKLRRCNQFLMAIAENGNTTNITFYCSETLKWMKCPLDSEIGFHFGAVVMDDNLYIVGGKIQRGFVNTVSCLNFETMTLKRISPMNKHRGSATPAVLKGFLYVVGGSDNGSLSSVERWDPIQNRWNFVASMSVRRLSAGVTAFNDKLYVVGGYNDGDGLRSAEYYDPEENVWVSIASMHKARRCPRLAVANGVLYAIGGGVTTIERYNPDSDQWTMLCRLNEHTIESACTLFDDKVMLLYEYHVEEYNFKTNECKVNPSINGLVNVVDTFSYTGRLLVEKFVEY